jgi:hypothetical protein
LIDPLYLDGISYHNGVSYQDGVSELPCRIGDMETWRRRRLSERKMMIHEEEGDLQRKKVI